MFRQAASEWLTASPDHTLYHLAPYLDFMRAHDRNAEVFLSRYQGAVQFALPVHSWSEMGLDSGYSGIVFPATRREATLRRSVTALAELFEANRHLAFQVHQSAQAVAYEDQARTTLLQRLLEGVGLKLEPIYGRLSDLDHFVGEVPTAPGYHPYALAIDGEWLTSAIGGYDPDLRNQIRQAVRHGLSVEYTHAGDPHARAEVYGRWQPIHEESWHRTGLLPKPPEHWASLSEAIASAGAEDLVTLVLDSDGAPLAGVVCHAYRSRAIYWSGCGSAAGLRLRANQLCLHGAMAACRRIGVETFELGRFRADERSAKERAITTYKAQFGGRLVRVTTLASAAGSAVRARAALAGTTFEARRRIALTSGRVRARLQRGSARGSAPGG